MVNFIVGGLLLVDAFSGVAATLGLGVGLVRMVEGRMEFRPGEGLLTPSVKFRVTSDSGYPLGRDIAAAATVFDVLKRYVGKTYMMTVVEETQVKALVRVLNSSLQATVERMHREQPEAAVEAHQIAQQAAESLAVFFWQFPTGRVSG